MSDRELEPFDAKVQRLLADERSFPAESAELRARVLWRVRESLRSGPVAPARSFWRTRLALLAAAMLVTVLGVAAVANFLEQRGAPATVPSAAPPAEKTSAGVESKTPPAPEVVSEDVLAPRAEAAAPLPESAKTSIALRRSSTNDVHSLELAILKRARAAVASGRFSTALTATAEHQRRFPDGHLREEREALRVKALAGIGKNDEARAAAERFRERYPDSVLAPRLETTARSTP